MSRKTLQAPLRWLVIAAMILGLSQHRTAQAQEAQREEVNRGVVGVIAGNAQGTHLDVVADLADALNRGYELRILPIVGEGSVRSVEDLLYLRGIDLAIVQSDVLDFYEQNNFIPNASQQIRYIARLFDEEVHLLARKEIASVADLEGKPVNFGPDGDGSFLTSGIIFDTLSIDVNVQSDPHSIALSKLVAGDIDAMMVVGGKPMNLLQTIDQSAGVHFLDLAPDKIRGAYAASSISDQDYPDLFAPGERVETVATAAVLAAYNWPSDHPRGEKVRRFVASFFEGGFDKLLEPPFHPKWRDVNLNAEVPGWQRLEFADRYLASQ